MEKQGRNEAVHERDARGRTRSRLRRAHIAAVFALLLLAVSAVPVLADPSHPGEGPPALDPSKLPDAEDIATGINQLKAEEDERLRQLEAPAAVQERKDSVDAYTDLSASAARQLLHQNFEEVLSILDADPARYLSEERLLRPLGEQAATVSSESGPRLMDSNVPVRVRDEDGDLRKVDLRLQYTREGLEPANPIVPLTIASSPEEGVEVGSIEIAQVGVDADSPAQRFEGQNAFFPEVQPSTDLLVSPTSTGVELFDQLRAAESPETLRFNFDLPAGAKVQASEDGGAEVLLSDGKPLGHVSAPTAVDAAGTVVPVHMEVEGSTLVLDVKHRDKDFLYPILVDPEYQVFENWLNPNWYGGGGISELENPSIWGWDRNTTKITNSTIGWHNWVGGSNRGLFTTSYPGSFGFYEYGQWSYWVPDWDVFIDTAIIEPFWRTTNGCNANTYPIPAEYDGLWDGSQWNQFKTEEARNFNWSLLDSWGKILVIGMSSFGGGSDPCYRDLYVGGVGVWMGDWNPPLLSAPSGMPSDWITDGASFTVHANASDEGLGVKRVTIVPKGTTVIQDQVGHCIGTRASKCPEFHSTALNATAGDFDEGETGVSMVAEDPTGKTSGVHWWPMRVDRTPPGVTLSGQLAELTKEVGSTEVPDGNDKGDRLSFPVYNLTITAEDGEITADPKERRSGVKDIEVFLDGKSQPEEAWHQSCPASSCSMTQVFQLKLDGLSAGQHTLRVVVRDQVGQERERKIEFEYFPATGMKDEYVMQHFPLPDGKDHEGEQRYSGPELAVNLMNGNLVYRERDVNVEGVAADLEIERFYNSQLPAEQNTEWGDGWSLAQTPELDPIDTGGSPAPDEAGLLNEGGSYDAGIELPTGTGEEEFDPELQATVAKTADGYELTDEAGESAGTIAFDSGGRTEELQTGELTGVEYDYEDGALAEIAVDDPGSTDLLPQEVVEPVEEEYGSPEYQFSFGSQGSGNGQFNLVRDLAAAADGTLWTLEGHRLQHFDAEGQYLGQVSINNSGASGLTVDPATGDLLLAHASDGQIYRFSETGAYLNSFGSFGSALDQFGSAGPWDVAADQQGDIWTIDLSRERVLEFSPNGELIQVVGIGEQPSPLAIDIGAKGDLFVLNYEGPLSVFNPDGEFVREVGAFGYGGEVGEFFWAVDVAVRDGNVWVSEEGGTRVQQFSEAGSYLGTLEAPEPFGLPSSIAADSRGALWIVDFWKEVQRWQWADPPEEYEPVQDDPAVALQTDDGLISGLEGEEAGEHSYEHEGDLLTAHEGPEGETAYEYDEADRLTKVTLSNGTTATIEYNATYGRVKAVTVDPAGEPAAKMTHFDYSEEPRRTTVTPEDAPAVTYDIGPEGSIVKWRNTLQPPELDDLAGGLYTKRETEAPIPTGDHNLVIQAYSEEGIASIEIIANGTTLVDEKHCDWKQEGIAACVEVANEWVTNTANWAPGILQLEVVATDRLGYATSARFWVNIPYTPPTPEGQPDPPTFGEVLKFREEFGLDLDLDPQEDELELNDRIFDLIGEWYLASTPLGEVARSSYERWGVPLRPVDVAELKYREWYVAANGPLIDEWGKANRSATYAGYFVDHRSGGILRVGFTKDQAQNLTQIKEQQPVVASDRISTYITPPLHSRSFVETTEETILSATISNSALNARITEVGVEEGSSVVQVGASNVVEVQEELHATLGPTAPFTVVYQPERMQFDYDRSRKSGRVRAGDWIFGKLSDRRHWCNAGFGAFEDRGKRANGSRKETQFLLTAGHCGRLGDVYLRSDKGPLQEQHVSDWSGIGVMTRNALPLGGQ
ncbi:MAG TPA: DUF6531 domain-containing protein, partial [Solirubrobacterales bacterium]|nr:DUF6531 domain-containing protein [Solirubrobacterales bacterium]